jgi:uncharacterized protein
MLTCTTCARQQPATGDPTQSLTIAAYSEDSLYYRVALAMREPLRLRGIDINILPGTSIENVRTLQRRQADIGVAAADAAYYAYVGELDPDSLPYDALRGIAVLQVTGAAVVAGPNSGIRQFTDLTGRSVSIGGRETTLSRIAPLMMDAFGVKASVVHTMTTPEATRALLSGTLDAMFVGVSADGAGVEDLTRAGARLLPLSGPPIDHFRPTAISG